MAKIEIYSRYVKLGPIQDITVGVGGRPLEHLCIKYTDDDGNERIIRGNHLQS